MVRKKLLWMSLAIPLILSVFSVTMMGVTVAQVTHDVAVVSVTPSPTVVVEGELVNVMVVVENQGTVNETFNVTAYHCMIDSSCRIGMKTVQDLGAGANTSITFTWNTTGTAGAHTVLAEAGPIPGETDTKDNTLLSGDKVTIMSSPYIAVIPLKTVDTTLTPGENYAVSIYTDYNGTDIWGYEFTLTYNPLVLHGISVTNGDLITKAKNETAKFDPGTFNNTLGELSLTGAAFYYSGTPLPLTSGPGTLANVTFTVVGTGDSDIELGTETFRPSRLIGANATTGVEYNLIDDITPDLGHILHGYFRNVAAITHDVAVLSVTPYPTWVMLGDPANITVVVENQGTIAERFEVVVYYDYDPKVPGVNRIGMKTVQSLAAGASMSLTFTWNTTEVGSHTITAVASELPRETDTEDNTLKSDEIVTVGVIYIRADGSVDPPTVPIQRDGDVYTFTDNVYGPIVVERDNIVVDGAGYTLQGKGSGTGIELFGRSNITIKNMEIIAFTNGIELWWSSNITVLGNNITANEVHGIDLDLSSNNSISANNITANNLVGIKLGFSSSNNSIFGNNIRNNFGGIRLVGSSNNSISGNNISNNEHGIQLLSSNNTICQNNFINNTQHVWNYPSIHPSINTWDDGYPSGGNYWSNYTGVDLDHDGIGDSPHIIDANNTDNHPLMGPVNVFDAGTWNNIAYHVNVASNSTVSDFYFNPDEGAFIRFNVDGPDGTTGFCRVAVPKQLLSVNRPEEWIVMVGDKLVVPEVSEDENYTYLYFTYNHSTKTVTVTGTRVVPEFPSTTIIALFTFLTLVLVVLTKKRRTHTT